MKKILSLLLIITCIQAVSSFTEDDPFWIEIYQRDYQSYLEEYQTLQENDELNDLENKAKLIYALYSTGENEISWLSELSSVLEDNLSENEILESPLYSYLMAEAYMGQIVDAPSWMALNNQKEFYMEASLTNLPDEPRNILLEVRDMLYLPSSRGSAEDGRDRLEVLLEENPTHVEANMIMADQLLDDRDIQGTLEKYRIILDQFPNYNKVIKAVESLRILDENRAISEIRFVGSYKIPQSWISSSLEDFQGQQYNFESKNAISEKLTSISPIQGVDITAVPQDNGMVDLEIEISENNTQGLMFLLNFQAGRYGEDLVLGGIPAVAYFNSNLFGTGINAQFMSAIVYNQLELSYPGIIGKDTLDIKLSLDWMALPTELKNYYPTEEYEVLSKSSNCSAAVALGHEFPIGCSVEVNYKTQWDFYEDLSGRTTPDHNQSHSLWASLEFSTMDESFSQMDHIEGFSLLFQPAIHYIPNYSPWGVSGAEMDHDDRPAQIYRTELSYFKSFLNQHNAGISAAWLGSVNNYHSSSFILGHPNMLSSDALSGYLPGELALNNAVLCNLDYSLLLNEDKMRIYAGYDMVYDLDESEYHQGALVGSAFALPWDIEMSVELGYAVDAERDDDLNRLFTSVTLSRISLF